MKKILTYVLAFALLFASFPAGAVSFTDLKEVSDPTALLHLTNLDIIKGYEDNTFRPEEVLTRGEFAVIITRILNVVELAQGTENIYFSDVPKNHFASGAIAYCAAQGYLSGYGNGIFEPNRPVGFSEAVKVLVSVLGYGFYGELAGGYPNGYRIKAKEMDLLKGLGHKNTEALNRGETATLVYNSLFIPLLMETGFGENVSFVSEPDVNILTKYLKLNMDTGIVNNDGITKIDYVSDVDKEFVVIGNRVLNQNGKVSPDFLGRKVQVIYTSEEHKTPNQIISIVKDKITKEFSIASKSIEESSGKKIAYLIEDKKIDVNLATGAKVVYNGVFDFTFDLSTLKDLKDTKITFVENTGDNSYDLVLIEKAETYVVMSSIGERHILRDLEDGSKALNLDDVEHLIIIDSSGKTLTLEELEKYNVQIASVMRKDDYYAKIILSDLSAKGKLDEIGNDLNNPYIVIEGVSYPLAEEYRIKGDGILNPSDEVTGYFDAFGNLIYIEKNASSGYLLGYLVNISPTLTFEQKPQFKLFTRDNKFTTYEADKKIKIGDSQYYAERDFAQIKTLLTVNPQLGYSQFVAYKLTSEGLLREIHPATSAEEGYLFKMAQPSDTRFSTTGLSFGGIVNVGNQTWLIRVPATNAANADEKDFHILDSSMFANEVYSLEYYITSYKNNAADIVVIKNDNLPKTIKSDDPLVVLLSKSYALDSNGTPGMMVRYALHGEMKDIFIEEGSKVSSTFNRMGAGDVFRFSKDIEGSVNDVEYYYQARGDRWAFSTNQTQSYINYYTATTRIAKGYVSYLSGGVLRMAYQPVISTAKEAQQLESFKPGTGFTISVVTRTPGGSVIVRKGNDKDLSLLDPIVIRLRGGAGREIIIYKGEDWVE